MKFVEGRTIELKRNAGLELPSNIGELGDSVTKIDLSGHGLRGEFDSAQCFEVGKGLIAIARVTGVLPLWIIRMKAKGCDVSLGGNEPGFTLPSNIGELGDDIVKLDLSGCSLQGQSCIRAVPSRHKSQTTPIVSRAQRCRRRCRRRSNSST